MLNSLKYNWKKKSGFILIAFIVMLLLNISIYLSVNDSELIIIKLMVLNVSLFGISNIVMFVMHIKKMNILLFSEEGQFRFLTPVSSYQILASDLVGALIDLLLLYLTYFIVFTVNMRINDTKILKEISSFIRLNNIEITKSLSTAITTLFISYSILLMTIFLSMILVKTLFYNFKYKKSLSFIVFIFINKINNIIYDFINTLGDKFSGSLEVSLLIGTVIVLTSLYIISGYLLEEKISA